MDQKHTPTPWQLNTHWSRSSVKVFVDIGGVRTSFVECANPADGEFIVRACNAHEQLAAALEQICADLRTYTLPINEAGETVTDVFAAVLKKADEALAAAGAA